MGDQAVNQQVREAPAEFRADFFAENHLLCCKDLKALWERKYTQQLIKESEDSLVGTGQWLDEIDLRKKYEYKPGYADLVIQAANRKEHPNTKVVLYEDMQYQTTERESSKRTVTNTSELCQDGVYKKAKVVKPTDDGAANGPDNDPSNRQWSDAQKAQMSALADSFVVVLTSFREKMQHIKDNKLESYIPTHALNQGDMMLAKIEATKAELEVQIQEGTPET